MYWALIQNGPIAASVQVDDAWQNYKSGVMSCPEYQSVNHAVLIVGYGNDDSGSFWIVKNSYGDDWGEKGFIRLRVGASCNITA